MDTLKINSSEEKHRFLYFFIMLYMTIKITTILMIYKVINLFGYTISVSAFIMPLWFFLGDIITEVYGYQLAKKLIWGAIACQIIFATICAVLSTIPSATDWSEQYYVNQSMLRLPRVAISSSLAIFAGAFINAYAISKWRILLKGQYFWLRSLGATAIGEFIFTIISYIGEFVGITSLSKVFQLIMISYVTKLLINLILVIPAAFICYTLNTVERSSVQDKKVAFNPFS